MARVATPSQTVHVDGVDVTLSNPDKVLFPAAGVTKADLVAYYLAVGEPLLEAMGGRPVLLQRFPNGVGKQSFFQKRIPDSAPEWLQTTTVATPNGTESRALVVADLAHVVWAVNLASLGFHVWPYLAADPAHVDELRIDLDPQPGVRFAQVREAAAEVRTLLDELGIDGRAKTTGSRGIHVYVALQARWDAVAVRQAAVALARELERRRPDLLTAAWWKEKRGTRVFVDFNQNAPHKTVFGAWSARARTGAQVSCPFAWDDLDAIDPEACTVATVPERLAPGGDPWAGMRAAPQTIDALLGWFWRDIDDGLMDAPWPPVYPKMPLEPPRVAPSRAAKPDDEA